MAEYRNYETVLKEAELIAMPPHAAAEWFAQNAQNPQSPIKIDDQLEKKLLGLGNYNIDLVIARYGQCKDVLAQLFHRNDDILRIALFANEGIVRQSFVSHWPFVPGEKDEFKWLGQITDRQLQALFSNKSLPEELINQFFAKGAIWLELNNEQRLAATEFIIMNLEGREPDDDDWYDYGRSSMINAAWEFCNLVDVTIPWAARLGRLYSNLPPDVYSDFDALKAAKRWYPIDEQEKAKEKTEKDKYGYLGYFQSVRCGLARVAARSLNQNKSDRNKLLNNRDLAIRCGAYLSLDLTTEEIEKACKKDGAYACRHIVENDRIWRTPDNRWELEQACDEASKHQDFSTLRGYYEHRKENLTKKFPSWFEEKDDEDSYGFERKKLSEVSLKQLKNSLSSELFSDLNLRITALSKSQNNSFIFVVVILVLILIFKN